MRVDGLYFNKDEATDMLKRIESTIRPAQRKEVMPLVKEAMDDSAGKGYSGEPSCTSVVKTENYQITANVCCGGYAEIEILKVSKVL